MLCFGQLKPHHVMVITLRTLQEMSTNDLALLILLEVKGIELPKTGIMINMDLGKRVF